MPGLDEMRPGSYRPVDPFTGLTSMGLPPPTLNERWGQTPYVMGPSASGRAVPVLSDEAFAGIFARPLSLPLKGWSRPYDKLGPALMYLFGMRGPAPYSHSSISTLRPNPSQDMGPPPKGEEEY
jgi:hypothetical protein